MNKLYILIPLLVFSCSETTEELYSSDDIPVVESVIFEGAGPTVELTKLIPFDTETEETASALTALKVYISNGEQEYLLEESEQAGIYTIDQSLLTLNPNQTYHLHFEYGSTVIEAYTSVPTRPTAVTNLEEIQLEEISDFAQISAVPNDEGQLTISWDEKESAYYIIQMLYTSSSYSQVISIRPIDDVDAAGQFTSEPIQGNSYTFSDRQLLFYGNYDIIVHRITEEYASLYESLNNSSLDEIAEPYTNITNGKGIFTAINSDTVQIQVIR